MTCISLRINFKNFFFFSLEISSISSPFTVDGQAKFHIIYSRRSIADYAFGLGACLRYVDFDLNIAANIIILIQILQAKFIQLELYY